MRPGDHRQWKRGLGNPSSTSEGEIRRRYLRARIVAQKWLDDVMGNETLRRTGMSHPLAMVMAALDGETDPVQMGVDPDTSIAVALREVI